MRNIIKRLLLALLAPVLFLALLEGVLALTGFGHDTGFLVSAEVDGEPVWVENPFFTYTVFDPPLARIPASIVARQDKPADLFRVVVLGESAAMGDPIPDFGVPRVLEYALRHADPSAKVEVINAAITAINSHIIKDIARDLDKLKPDVVILYIGNNEIIGPFGPGTTFSGYLASDALIDAIRWVNRTRTSQLIWQGVALAKDRREKQEFGGVAMFVDNPVPAHDPRLEAVRRRYANNLRTIIERAHATGARILVSTVAVNREACPPSIAVNRPDLAGEALLAWQKEFERGSRQARLKNWPEALTAFAAAARLDDQHAGLHYSMAICLKEAGRADEAHAHFAQAMNLDAFRYRTDDALNDIARELGASSGEGIVLVDADAAFRDHPVWNDEDLFIDHVHFSFKGTAQLAAVWMDALSAMPGLAAWSNRQGFPETDELKDTLLYKGVAEISVVQEMARRYSKPPFTLQVDHQARLRALQARAAELNEQLRTQAHETLEEAFRDRLARFPDDLYFPMHFAQHLVSLNRFAPARPVAEAAMQKHPFRRGPRSVMAHLLALEDRTAEAADVLLGYLSRHGYFAAVSSTYLVEMLTAAGYHDEAVAATEALAQRAGALDYRHRIREQHARVRAWRDRYVDAREHIRSGRLAQADQQFAALHRARPDLGEPLAWQGIIEGMRGQPRKGVASFGQGVERMNFLHAHYFAGLWQARSENFAEARDMLGKAAAMANDDPRIVNSLAWIYAADPRPELRDPAKARSMMEGFIARRPDPPSAAMLDTLAATCARAGDVASAIAWAERAMEQAQREGRDALAEEIKQRLAAYRSGEAVAWGTVNGPAYYF